MAQIRSKQIADFLSSVNWASVNSTDIANAADIKALVSSEIAAVNGDNSAVSDALVAEISATNSDFVRVEAHLSAEIYDARLYTSDEMLRASEAEGVINESIDSLELALAGEITDMTTYVDGKATSLETSINTEKGRVDAILDAADADKDTFVEIVSLINAVDLTNDDALAAVILDLNSEISATNSDFVRVEAELSAEISATNSDVTSIDARLGAVSGDLVDSVDSLELALSAEISATDSDFVRVEANLSTEIVDMTTYVDGEVSTLNVALNAEISATNSDFVRVEANLSTEIADMTTYVDGEVTSLEGFINDEVSTLEASLSAEISATDADITSIDTRLGAVSGNLVDSVDSLELALTAEIDATDADFTSVNTRVSIEEGRVDAILLAADADKDSFAEIVSLINTVDTTNDTAFASYALATDASIDSLEVALTAEIDATNSDVTRIDAALSAEISATNSDFVRVEANLSTEIADMTTYVDGEVTSLEGFINGEVDTLETSIGSLETAHGDRLTSLEGFIMEDAEMQVEEFEGNGLEYLVNYEVQDGNTKLVNIYVNGQRVKTDFAMVLGGAFAGKTSVAMVDPGYTVDADDTVVIVFQSK